MPMTPRAVLAIVACLAPLVAMMPTASALVDTWSDGGASASATQPNGAASFQVAYALRLSGSGSVQLFSSVQGPDGAVDHSAAWDLGGGRTTGPGSSALVDGLPTGQDIPVSIVVTLPDSVPAGQYTLQASVRQRASGSGASQAPVTDAKIETTPLTLSRPPPASLGGGAGSGATPGLGSVTGVRFREVDADHIRLEWPPLGGEGISYIVYRGLQAGVEVIDANVIGTPVMPAFDDLGLTPDTQYFYRVRAQDTLGRVGPASAEVSARTAPGPDRTPPPAVEGLRSAKVNDRSISLQWDEAEDDRGLVSYEVHRGAPGFTASPTTRIGTTTALGHTDIGLIPATRYAYRVRAVDAAGNAGPYSAALEVSTVTAPIDLPPVVSRIEFLDEGRGWEVSWITDERATGGVQLSGPLDVSRTLGPRATFSAELGDLPAGTYAYSIAVTDDTGEATEVNGRFAVEAGLGGRLLSVGDRLADDLGTRLGLSLEGASLFFVDQDLDGTFERFLDAEGDLESEHSIPSRGLHLVAARGQRVLVGTDGSIESVRRTDGTVTEDEESEAVRRVGVRVADKSGWILASVSDPAPRLPLLGVERADGEALPDGSAWRSGSRIQFLDDPSEEYVLVFDNAPTARLPPPASGIPDWALYAAAGGGLLLGILVTVLVMRRRRA